MKERPIIFSSQMVKVILEGRKSQTRRPMKPQPFSVNPNDAFVFLGGQVQVIPRLHLICPYGIVGDRLWVRETWALIYKDEGCLHDEDEIKCPCEGCNIEYKADTGNPCPGEWDIEDARKDSDAPRWRSPIHMPHWASRITLEILNVKVERLQEITDDDAQKEGCQLTMPNKEYPFIIPARMHFVGLWDSIYSKKGMGWNVNPWIFVIEFRRIS